MIRMIGVLVALVALATPAAAQRPSTLAMTCAEAQDFIASRGAAVMSTGRHTYERFVRGANFCILGEYADPAFAPTADAPSCRLFYICRPRPSPLESPLLLFRR